MFSRISVLAACLALASTTVVAQTPVYDSDPRPDSVITLTGTVDGPMPSFTLKVTNASEERSILTVDPGATRPPLVVSPDAPPTDIPNGETRNFEVACLARERLDEQFELIMSHKDAEPNGVKYFVICRIREPPELTYDPLPGSSIVVPATTGGAVGKTIAVVAKSGESGGERALDCVAPEGFTAVVETSPFQPETEGLIQLSCPPAPLPAAGQLTCTESPGGTVQTWDLSCLGEPIFDATPAAGTPILVEGVVGEPDPSVTISVGNIGTSALDVAGPTGLSTPLSITPALSQSVPAGSAAIDYTITCNAAAAADTTQTVSFAYNGTASPATFAVTCNIRNLPTLQYAPLAGVQIPVSASLGGATPTATIAITTTGGGAGVSRGIGCTPPTGFTVMVEGSPVESGGTGAIRVGCNTLSPPPGNLSCIETPGDAVQEWPLICQNNPVYRSTPRPSAAVGIYGAIGDVIASAPIDIRNDGASALLQLSQCVVNPPGLGFALDLTTASTVAPNASGQIVIDCPPPASGTTLKANLTCNTNDPMRPSVLYRLFCVAPPLTDSGEGASPTSRLSSPSPDAGAKLGSATGIAEGSGGEEILVVGAPGGGANDDGRVYVFVRPPGSDLTSAPRDAKSGLERLGEPTAVLTYPRGKSQSKGLGDKFGDSVAVSSNGQFIAVGAPSGGSTNVGQVVVFTQPPGGWGDLASLPPTVAIAPPTNPGVVASAFGAQVEFAPDGLLVVGAPAAIVGGVNDAGAVFRFETSGAFPPVGAPITATSAEQGAEFGAALDVGSGMLAVGAPGENTSRGAAYFFEATASSVGPANRQTAQGGQSFDKWGSAVVVAGNSIIVGAPNDTTAAGAGSGSATVFTAGNGNNVTLATTLIPPPGGAQGAGAAIASNGDVVVLGAPLTNVGADNRRGRAIMYDLDAAAVGIATPAGVFENAIGAGGDEFGGALAISRRRLLIGAPLSDEGTDLDEGRADPFVLDRIFRGNFDR
ncbi:MAG TPA: hypothetical protein VND91_04455 [Candidatus Saccharimonadia bacterium]|nr:hypothetical protein [Candidatus Saccharimonadia bacterium]